MSIKKKIISCAAAVALAVTSAVTLSGCADVGRAYVIDGEDIPAGVYILYSGYALDKAREQLSEEQPDLDTTGEDFDFYAQTVSGMSFGDYVKQETVNYCKRYVAINRLFDELDIQFEADERENINDNINAQWDFDVSNWSSMLPYLKGFGTMGDYYQSIGVAKSSYREVMLNGTKASEIFDYYYGEGGVEEVPHSDIEAYVKENYTLARYFSISLNDDEGQLIEDEKELAVLEELANGYADDLNNGTSYSEVYKKYEKYFNDEDEDEGEGEEEEHEDSEYDRIINVESTSPSAEFVEALFKQEIGTATVFKTDTNYYVVQRLDITENEEYVDDYADTARSELKNDELDSRLEAKYAAYTANANTSAPDYAREQADNARQGLSTINTIQYYSYYSSLFGY